MGSKHYRQPNDIKAPDGFLLGGERLVRPGGVILFQRGWWQVPADWAGEYCMVHCSDGGAGDLEVAPPGWDSIYAAQSAGATIAAPRTSRPDALPGVRKQWVKDHYAKSNPSKTEAA